MQPEPAAGRVHEEVRTVGIAHAAPTRRARMDALVDWLQDVAYADVLDAGMEDGVWVVRRSRLEVARVPVLGERLRLRTWCSASSPRVAERRTSIAGSCGAAVETVAVWVHLDPATGAPARLGERFAAVYGPSASGRRPDHRLRHGPPPADAASRPWTFRAADIDVAGHVNNAAYWEVLEEDLAGRPLTSLSAEAEHRAPALAGAAVVRSAGDRVWVTSPEGEVHASFALRVGGARLGGS